MKIKHILAGALTCSLLLTVTACGKTDAASSAQETVKGTPVEVISVERGDMSALNSLSGTITAVHTVQVFPMLAGEVLKLNVTAGDSVKKGDLLFAVDTSTVTSTYSNLQDSLEAAEITTNEAIKNAKTNRDNTKALYEIGAASKFALDQAESAVLQAEAAKVATLAQIRASMSQISAQADNGEVYAPCNGLVTSVNIVKGGMAAQSGPAVVIAEEGKSQVTVSVSETVLAGLTVGDTASVSLRTLSGDPLTCTIKSISPAANEQTKLYDVDLTLPEGVNSPIGTFADVILYTNHRSDTVKVPTEAILTDGATSYVFLVDNNTAKKTTVETGLVGDGETEIISGLTGGETLVTVGQSYLSDGTAVTITEDK